MATTRSGEGISKPMTAHKRQPSRMDLGVTNLSPNYDHDYEGTAKEIWEQMTYPTVENEMKSIIQLYENWSKGNLQHCQYSCDVSSDPNLCCYKDFDLSRDGEEVLLDFKIETTKTINKIVLGIHRNTPGERLLTFPKFAVDKLREFSNGIDRIHQLTPEEKQILVKATGLRENQVVMWWSASHNKKHKEKGFEKASIDGGPDLTEPPNASSSRRRASTTPNTTLNFQQRRQLYFSDKFLEKRGETSNKQEGGDGLVGEETSAGPLPEST